MMLVLPLQASWAAVASYCQHESEPSTYHFGHHVHQHHAADSGDSKEKRSTILSHDDCLHSHGGVVALTIEQLTLITLQSDSLINPSINPDRFASFLSHRPEKPKWLRAA